MEVTEVSPEFYNNIIPQPYIVYNRVDFNVHNSDKCDAVHYYLFKKNKYRFGLIGGISGNELNTPFSAPFGGFSYVNEKISFEMIDEMVDSFEEYIYSKGISKVNIIYPPLLYNENFLSKLINAHYRKNYTVKNIDMDFYINTDIINDDYLGNIWHNARKNYNSSLKHNFKFRICTDIKSKEDAYSVVKTNRSSRGFPLRMTFEQVMKTIEIIKADFFLLSYEQKDVASAIVFWVAKDIVQIIYWGDITEYSELKPMNFLSYKLFEHYKSLGIKIIDIGHSTENSKPNYGLCDFKESIGCGLNLKFSFEKELK